MILAFHFPNQINTNQLPTSHIIHTTTHLSMNVSMRMIKLYITQQCLKSLLLIIDGIKASGTIIVENHLNQRLALI